MRRSLHAWKLALAALTLGVFLAACTAILGATGVPNPATGDAGADGHLEAAPREAARPPSDARPSSDGGRDGGQDGGRDSGTPDTGQRSGDAAHDAGTDACAGSCNTYAATVMGDGPIAYWRLNEPAGPTAHDLVSGNDGTYTGSVTFNEPGAIGGDAGRSVFLNSQASQQGYVSVTDGAGKLAFLDVAAFSLEVWAKPIMIRDDNTILSHAIHLDAGTEGYTLYVGTQAEAGVDFSRFDDGTEIFARDASVVSVANPPGWYYIVATYTGSVMTLYVNAERVATTPNTNPIRPITCTFDIGAARCGTTGYFDGYLTEVAVYDKALTQGQVSTHYAAAQ